ncbi:MAG: flagellar hook-length control protein FliK [Alphaproteobacteria bacterium]|nr:flagellar hook-length control protein FliK [Alphaproteobacteria bacterium]
MQASQTNQTSTISSAVQGFFASLRGSGTANIVDAASASLGIENKLFASILAASKDVDAAIARAQQLASEDVSVKPTDSNSAKKAAFGENRIEKNETISNASKDAADEMKEGQQRLHELKKERVEEVKKRNETKKIAAQADETTDDVAVDEKTDETESVVVADVATPKEDVVVVEERAPEVLVEDEQKPAGVCLVTNAVIDEVEPEVCLDSDKPAEDSSDLDVETLLMMQQALMGRMAGATKKENTEENASADADDLLSAQNKTNAPEIKTADAFLALRPTSKGEEKTDVAAKTSLEDAQDSLSNVADNATKSGQQTVTLSASEDSKNKISAWRNYVMNELMNNEKGVSEIKTQAPVVNSNITVAAVAPVNGGNGAALDSATAGSVRTLGSTASASQNTVVAEGTQKSNPYNFASQLSATRASRGGSSGLPSAVEQVSLYLHRQVKAGNDNITLQLRPAELGRIEIKLQIADDNHVQGFVIVDNKATLEMLSQDSGSLQRALQNAGLQADAGCMQFSLREDGGSSLFKFNSRSMAKDTREDKEGAALAEADAAIAAADIYYVAPGRVNFRV